jgi:hypothetical protein
MNEFLRQQGKTNLKAEARRPGEVNKIAVMYFDDTRSG